MFPEKEIIQQLSINRIKNLNIIGFIDENQITDWYKNNSAILIKGISDRPWIYISCDSISELNLLLDLVNENDLFFAVVEDWMLDGIKQRFNYEIELSTLKLYLSDDIVIPGPEIPLPDLSETDAEFVQSNSDYKEYLPVHYVKDRIKKGISSGLIKGDKLIAWGMTHDDGAIGFLHVLEEYRGRGYGKEVLADMIAKVRGKNKIPFVHVEEENKISLNLSYKLGFKLDRRVHWLKKCS